MPITSKSSTPTPPPEDNRPVKTLRRLRFTLARRLRPSFYKDYRDKSVLLANSNHLSLSQRYLSDLLSYCQQNNPYYQTVAPSSRPLADWPLLTKHLIRHHQHDLASVDRLPGTSENSSGGSTGAPLTFLQDDEYRRWAARTQEFYFREFHDIEWNLVPNVWLWGSDRDMRRMKSLRRRGGAFLRNRVILNTFLSSDHIWLKYIDKINSIRPLFVGGYAGSLYELARVVKKYNVALFRPRFVYSSAELLQTFMRTTIEEVFHAKVYDYYGSREVGSIAGECTSSKLHIFVANNIVEVVDAAGRNLPAHHQGQIAITNLHNFAMPLVRFSIEDTGSLSYRPCPCGSALPVLESLTGRITDHFRIRNGDLVHGEYFTHLFYARAWVAQFQIDQLDYDHIRISVVLNALPQEAHEAEITLRIKSMMGPDCRVDWQYVASIQRTAQGKHLYTRCLLTP